MEKKAKYFAAPGNDNRTILTSGHSLRSVGSLTPRRDACSVERRSTLRIENPATARWRMLHALRPNTGPTATAQYRTDAAKALFP